MFFSVSFDNFLYIVFFFLIEVIIPLVSQGFDFSFNSALVSFCVGVCVCQGLLIFSDFNWNEVS